MITAMVEDYHDEKMGIYWRGMVRDSIKIYEEEKQL